MPSHEEHCQHSLKRYGVRGDDIHSYIDEPCKLAGQGHRVYRHDTKTIMLVGEIFGAKYGRELAESIALDHITADHEEEVRHRNNLTKGVNSETARKDSGAWSNKGNSLSRLGRFDEAIECYDKALKINPQNANTWARKGLVEEKLDSKLEAAKSYRKVIELAPANDKITQLARQRLRELEGSFSSAEDPMQVLKLRLTKGEITQQEYRDCVELLKQ